MSGNVRLFDLFPREQKFLWEEVSNYQADVQEIRIRTGKPVIVRMCGREILLGKDGMFTTDLEDAYILNRKEMEDIFANFCRYSPYAFENEIRQGFMTVAGGHRIGICGQAVMEEGKIKIIKNISSMNVRISHQIIGVSDRILSHIYLKGIPQNTLILSPPGCGKTTMLRDLIRQISDGNSYGVGCRVCVVDERSEIAASWMGVPQNNLGLRTDVLDACSKQEGVMLLIRSMAPQVLAVDEIGGEEDMEVLSYASTCGSRILATAHGESLDDFIQKMNARWNNFFSCIVLLGKKEGQPVICGIYRGGNDVSETDRSMYDFIGMPGYGDNVSQKGTTESK
ncbi:MAG: stage III sporulation protein AA [Acetatifactor sp.]|nr:stage III sporulation protein AA [Acetatifactor sp.]